MLFSLQILEKWKFSKLNKVFSSTNNILVNLTSSQSKHIQHIWAYYNNICLIVSTLSIFWAHLYLDLIFSYSGASDQIDAIRLLGTLLFCALIVPHHQQKQLSKISNTMCNTTNSHKHILFSFFCDYQLKWWHNIDYLNWYLAVMWRRYEQLY